VRVTEGSSAARVKVAARELGFDHCRIAPIGPAPHAAFFADWLARGNAAEMHYLARAVDLRRNPARLAGDDAGLRSLIVVAVDYHQFDLPAAIRDDPSRGILAAYAWGDDYHEIIRPLLHELDAVVRSQSGRTSQGKALVDTGPVLERDWAQAAGIGFTGKHCCTIRPGQGSWLLLATLAVPEVLEYDPPPHFGGVELPPGQVLAGLPYNAETGQWRSADASWSGTCGRCTRCLAACPTDAFVGPFHLDARRCIAYWTIETQASIPPALRPHFGNRIFGCDICQEVCPYNRRLADTHAAARRAGRAGGAHRRAAAGGLSAGCALLAGAGSVCPAFPPLAGETGETRRNAAQRLRGAGQLGGSGGGGCTGAGAARSLPRGARTCGVGAGAGAGATCGDGGR
jgi:epoxyqueuosine reductase